MKTKEELEKHNEVLKAELAGAVQQDNSLREEFAKAFAWYRQRNSYGGELEVTTPTWEQIFVQVGKLLAQKDFYNLEGNVRELEAAVQEVRQTLYKKPETLE